MSRESPTLDELYGVGAEAADAQGQEESEFALDVIGRAVLHVAELQRNIDGDPDVLQCSVDELKECITRAFEITWDMRALRAVGKAEGK